MKLWRFFCFAVVIQFPFTVSSYGETLPAGLQYGGLTLPGETYTEASILQRLKRIDTECISRLLDDHSDDYKFIGSLIAKAPLTPAVNKQLASMADILDAKQSLIPGLASNRSSTWASLTSNVLISSAESSLEVIMTELPRYENRRQHKYLIGVLEVTGKTTPKRVISNDKVQKAETDANSRPKRAGDRESVVREDEKMMLDPSPMQNNLRQGSIPWRTLTWASIGVLGLVLLWLSLHKKR